MMTRIASKFDDHGKDCIVSSNSWHGPFYVVLPDTHQEQRPALFVMSHCAQLAVGALQKCAALRRVRLRIA